jgi:hypothetical protein
MVEAIRDTLPKFDVGLALHFVRCATKRNFSGPQTSPQFDAKTEKQTMAVRHVDQPAYRNYKRQSHTLFIASTSTDKEVRTL